MTRTLILGTLSGQIGARRDTMKVKPTFCAAAGIVAPMENA
jgi:hypothetical protein